MAEYTPYWLTKPVEWIKKVIEGAVIFTEPMSLTEPQKAQFRDNIGAASADNSWQPKGYFDTFEDLTATITNPSPGDAYGVGLEAPYNIWVWDALRGRWLDNGPIKGMDGAPGKDGRDGMDGAPGKDGTKTISYSNIIVSDQLWELGGDEEGYPYRAAVALPDSGVTDAWTVDVQFENPSENLSPRTLSYGGGFYIFVASPPETLVKILTAICSQTEVKEFANKVFATISVTYTEGKTVTCTNGDTVLTAKTTGGSWQFGVPHAGAWIVSDGENHEVVEITTQGQSESVSLYIWDRTIFDNGNQHEAVTGGWTSSGYTTDLGNVGATIGNALTVSCNNGQGSAVGTEKPVDLTNFSTLYVTATSAVNGVGFAVGKTKNVMENVANGAITANTTNTLDISNISGEHYIVIFARGSSVNNNTATITKAGLE